MLNVLKKTRVFVILGVIACALSSPGAMQATLAQSTTQEAAKPAPPPPPPMVPLKIDVVISRYDGEKKISSLPFSVLVNANKNGQTATLNMGVEVPLVSTADSKPTLQYRPIGTGINCSASSVDGGRFQLTLGISDSSVFNPDPQQRSAAGNTGANMTSGAPGYPVFRSYSSNTSPVLRDGQTLQFNMATDKVSGEVLKVDVTLTVIK